MSVVIDASVALKWVADEPGTQEALALRGEQLLAPSIWIAEAANGLWRHVRLGEVTSEEALGRIAQLEKAPVTSLPIEPYVAAALELAIRANHPVYDCLYLALAIDRDTQVVTEDCRFRAAAARLRLNGRVRPLGN